MAALDGEVAVHGDARGIGPAVAAVIDIAGKDLQAACTRGTALDGEAARSVQSADEGLIFVGAGRIDRDVAAADGIDAAVGQDDGGPGGQLYSCLGGGGEVDAPEGQGLGAVIPRGDARAGPVLIQQVYGWGTTLNGEVCRIRRRRRRGKGHHRHQRQHHAQRQQDGQQFPLDGSCFHKPSPFQKSFSAWDM